MRRLRMLVACEFSGLVRGRTAPGLAMADQWDSFVEFELEAAGQ